MLFGLVLFGLGAGMFVYAYPHVNLKALSEIPTSNITPTVGQTITVNGQLTYTIVYYTVGGSSWTWLLQGSNGFYYGFYLNQPATSIANNTQATVTGVYLGGSNLGSGGDYAGLIEPSQIITAITTQTFSTSTASSQTSQTGTFTATITCMTTWTHTGGYLPTPSGVCQQLITATQSTTTSTCTATSTITTTGGYSPHSLPVPPNGSCYVFVSEQSNSPISVAEFGGSIVMMISGLALAIFPVGLMKRLH